MMKNKIILSFFVLVIFALIVPNVTAEESNGNFGKCGANVTWAIDDSYTLTISGTGDMYDYDDVGRPWEWKTIKNIIIENGVTSIGSHAFSGKDIDSVTLPGSITHIGNSAFGGWSGNVDSVYITDIVSYLNTEYDSYASNPMYYANKLYIDNRRVVSLTIPQGATKIPDYAFYGCDSIKNVTMPDGITSIGYKAFENCSELTEVVMPDSVVNIDEEAFYNCRKLTGIVIPDRVKSIGNQAFYDCAGLESIIIPDSVTYIGSRALASTGLVNVKLSNSITSIPDGIFSYCTELKSITIPDQVRSIGNEAFDNCTSLRSIIIPDSVKKIGSMAFRYCTALQSVRIGSGVESIVEHVFYYCTNLETVELSKNIMEIEQGAFDACPVRIIEYGAGESEWENVYINKSNNEYFLNAKVYYTEPLFEIDNNIVKNTSWKPLVATVITVRYDNGVLDNIASEKIRFEGGETKTFIDVTNYYDKVFVWNSLSGMKPLIME